MILLYPTLIFVFMLWLMFRGIIKEDLADSDVRWLFLLRGNK